MIHKFNDSERFDLSVGHLEQSKFPLEEENEMLMSGSHNGKDHFFDLPDALIERDIMHLRDTLREIAGKRKQSLKMGDVPFDLTGQSNFDQVLEEADLEEISQLLAGKPLPKIHLHHHRRAMGENQHQFYLEQLEAVEGGPDEEFDQEYPVDLPGLEEALKESDIMNLREKLQHLPSSVIQTPYSAEEIDKYLAGEGSKEDLDVFEADLELNPLLLGDVSLFTGIDEAVGERDIMAMRAKLERLMQSEHSSSRTLPEAEDYVQGELTDEQKAEFENDLFEQRDLRAEVNLLKNLEKSMQEEDILSLRDQLKQISMQEDIQGKKTGSFVLTPVKEGRLRRNGTYAALFLLLVGISSLMFHFLGSAPPEYDQYFPSPQTIGAFRSVDNSTDPELLRGFDLLRQNEYPGALISFGKVLQQNNQDQSARFYSGFTCQKLNRDGDALFHFKQITGAAYSMFTQQAGWYAILSKLRLYGAKSVITDLDAIIDTKGYYYKDALALRMRLLKEDE